MARSDSEDEAVDDLELDRTTDADAEEDAEVDDDIFQAIEGDAVAGDATEGDEETGSDDSEDGSEDEDDEESEKSGVNPPLAEGDHSSLPPPSSTSSSSQSQQSKAPSPPLVNTMLSLTPAQLRKKGLFASSSSHRSYTVEAICALPHPSPTHALASSLCMTHLLTGSDDGYIRDYNVFAAVNGKNFLTAPQRHHCGVVEGIMKAGQIRCWWENPALRPNGPAVTDEDIPLSPIYSLLMHSDALWALAGTDTGHVNLFTVRHDPGRLIHVMNGHRGHVSALAMAYDEKGFFSAGWDGDALEWDLNTGQNVRRFTAHGAQLAAIAVRPTNTPYHRIPTPSVPPPPSQESLSYRSGGSTLVDNSDSMSSGTTMYRSASNTVHVQSQTQDADAKSDASFDPLFDDEPDADGEPDSVSQMINGRGVVAAGGFQPSNIAVPSMIPRPMALHSIGRSTLGIVAPPKNAPPLLNASTYTAYSPDVLMTASIDGQVILWDRRVNTPGSGVGRLEMSEKTPPWCLSACWSADGLYVYAGRRNGTVDVWDVRRYGRSGPSNTPRLVRTLRNPTSSGVVSCVVAFPDGRHIACASNDNIRLWNASEPSGETDSFGKPKSGVQFKIIPGHHGGYISQMLVDVGARFLVSASSNRGWHGDSTRTVFVHEIKHV